MAMLRGQMDQSAAIRQLEVLNDPSTCSQVEALLSTPRITSAFPSAMAMLTAVQVALCVPAQAQPNNIADPNVNSTPPPDLGLED